MSQEKSNPSDQARQAILKAVLQHVPFEGWTSLSLKMAVADCDLPEGADKLYFPGGAREVLRFWSEVLDDRAAAAIRQRGIDNMRIRDKVTESVWVWLEQMAGHEQAGRRALSRLSLPDATGQGVSQLWSTADMIWRAIGDTSTDGNFYSKRMILSGVIGSTLATWLADDTADKSASRAFLERRIENVMQFEKFKGQVKAQTQNWPNPAEVLGRIRHGQRRRRTRHYR